MGGKKVTGNNESVYKSPFSIDERKQLIKQENVLVNACVKAVVDAVDYNVLLKFWADKRVRALTARESFSLLGSELFEYRYDYR